MYICIYVYTRPNYMDWSKDRWEQPCGRPMQCAFLRRNWPYSTSGNPGSTCFYEDSGTWCSNPSCFTVPAETRISGTTYFCGFPATGVPNMQCFFGYSGGRGRPLSRGTPRGRRKASGGRRFGKRVKTRWLRGPGAPNRVKNAYERCAPHEAVGQTVLPTASGVSPPGPRAANLRVLGLFWRNLAGSAPGNAP